MRSKFILAILMCLVGSITWAQTALSELGKIREKMETTEQFSTRIHFRIYDTDVQQAPIEEIPGEYARSSEVLYTRVGDLRTVLTPEITVIRDDDSKQILVKAASQSSISAFGNIPLEKALALCSSSSIEVLNDTSSACILRFDEKPTEFESIEIRYYPNSYELQSIRAYYKPSFKPTYGTYDENEAEVYEIAYSGYSESFVPPQSNYSEFLQKTPQGYVLRGDAEDFELIDQTQIKDQK